VTSDRNPVNIACEAGLWWCRTS